MSTSSSTSLTRHRRHFENVRFDINLCSPESNKYISVAIKFYWILNCLLFQNWFDWKRYWILNSLMSYHNRICRTFEYDMEKKITRNMYVLVFHLKWLLIAFISRWVVKCQKQSSVQSFASFSVIMFVCLLPALTLLFIFLFSVRFMFLLKFHQSASFLCSVNQLIPFVVVYLFILHLRGSFFFVLCFYGMAKFMLFRRGEYKKFYWNS